MGEFRTPGYDGPEGTEWPRPKRKDQKMAQHNGIPFPDDHEGMVIAVAECVVHGAHIDYLVVVAGHAVAGGQVTPEQADQLAADFASSAVTARAAIAASRN